MKMYLNTNVLVETLEQYQDDYYTDVWLSNYGGGVWVNGLDVDEDPEDKQAVKVGVLSNEADTFETFLIDIKDTFARIDLDEPVTVLDYEN